MLRDGKATSRYKDQPVNAVYRNNYCLFQELYKLPEDGGTKSLRNEGGLVFNSTELQPKSLYLFAALGGKASNQTSGDLLLISHQMR